MVDNHSNRSKTSPAVGILDVCWTQIVLYASGFEGSSGMRLAIVGGGISGLTAARLLHPEHEVHVFEAESRAGGHSNTVSFQWDGQDYSIDTGFIVYNDRTYPNFMKLLDVLGIAGVPTEMSFAVRCDRTGTEYSGTSLDGLFAQRRNLLSPSFLRMVKEILRFNRQGTSDADAPATKETVGEYLQRNGYGSRFRDHYLLPMGAAIWSCPCGTFADFPMHFILEFYRNHGLLSLTNRPQWYTIPGGSRRYVERLIAPFQDHLHVGDPVRCVRRNGESVTVCTETAEASFDEVIFACHSDQALSLLETPTAAESEILGGFPYSQNEAVLHTDERVLPRARRAWSAWNYRIGTGPEQRATITYNMNILQHIQSPHTFSVTLNDTDLISADRVISRHKYSHPIFTTKRAQLQSQHQHLIRSGRTSFCGAYWGNGFHEDGVNSALAVVSAWGIGGIESAAGSAFRPAEVVSASAQPMAGA